MNAGPHTAIPISSFAEPGVLSLIPAQPHTFMEFTHEIFSTVILLPLIENGLSVTRESMCTEYCLNCLV